MPYQIRLNTRCLCVYAHLLQGKILYIGCGLAVRPFSLEPRGKKWRTHLGELEYFDVKILKWFKNRRDAFLFERQMISKFKPVANDSNAPKHPRKPGKKRPVKRLECGTIYPSMEHAAKENVVSVPSIKLSLKYKKAVKGSTFCYVKNS